jgi:hypothetical protein
MKSKSGLENLTRAKARIRAYVRPEITPTPFVRAPLQSGHVSGIPSWMQCEFYGPVELTSQGRTYACGCTDIPFHRCERFGDLVTMRLHEKPIQKLLASNDIPEFRGRTCATCELWKPPITKDQ